MVRDIQPSDRTFLDTKLDSRFLDSGELQVVVADSGAEEGYATFIEGSESHLPFLGEIKAETKKLFYQLIDLTAKRSIDSGNKRAEFVIKDPQLLAQVERDFDVVVEPVGRNVKTGKPGYWRIEVDLVDARRQLARFI